MATFCPSCGSTYTGYQCLRCGASAQSMALTYIDENLYLPTGTSGRWHQTPPGRLFAGLLLSLGLSYGLLQLCASLIVVWARETGAVSLNANLGWCLLLGLLGAAVLAGAALSAVGAKHGKGYGIVIGLLSSGIAVTAIQGGAFARLAAPYLGSFAEGAVVPLQLDQIPLGKNLFYVLPVFCLLCGTAGGAVGGGIWRVPSRLSLPQFAPAEERPAQELQTSAGYHPAKAPPAPSQWTGPVAWGRVLFGILAACGVSYMHKRIIQMILIFAEGYIKIADTSQEALAVTEIFAIAILMGGAIAGATTGNGLKMGLIVGIGAGFGQALLILHSPKASDQLFYIMLGALFLAPLGGWFGSSMLPPAPPPRERFRESA